MPRVLPDGNPARTEAAAVLRAGGIVALPTDTVYGIACDLAIPGGIERLFAAKGRQPDRAIVLLLAEPAQAWAIGIGTAAARLLAERYWPGGLSLVLRRRDDVVLPAALTGGAATIGLRVPDHACPRALAGLVGPLPTTSANASGRPEARDAAAIVRELGLAVDLVLDGGPSTGGPTSTVVDCTTDRARAIRVGAIPIERLAAALESARMGHDL